MLLYQILTFITIHGKHKNNTKIIDLEYQLQHEMKSLNYLKYYILHQVLKIILSISSRNMRQLLITLQ